ncbi:MAG: GNAT family N-acetyltransferase [Hyphomicrobiales bacterium]|nr:GNAT family N-acetyltransferase [Hyphomicrobiales bacterium]
MVTGEERLDCVVIRRAEPSDRPKLLNAVAELQNYERELHETRLPGEQIADAYTRWMLSRAEGGGLVLAAESGGEFVGFAAAWIEQMQNVAETSDSNRFGFISDICILSGHRGKRIANQLLEAIVAHFDSAGITRVRVGLLAANRSAVRARALPHSALGFSGYEGH